MNYKVLLIDDEPLALEGLQLWVDWEKLGFEVSGVCANGLQGLQLMERHLPDLVLVDIHMPVMDGLEMIAEWRRRGHDDTRFIIITGHSDFDYARKALKYKVSRYLLKPLDEEQMDQEIRGVLHELMEEQAELHISQVARREKELLLIKELLIEGVQPVMDYGDMKSLSSMAKQWQVCLVQGPKDRFAELSRIALDFMDEMECAYLVHLQMDCFSIVFGDAAYPSEKNQADMSMKSLARRLAGFPVFMAIGIPVNSLTEIRASYLTAAEALTHAFYETGPEGIVYYHTIENIVFQPCFNHVELLESILNTFRLLEPADYQALVDQIEQSLREARVQPDEVRKFIVYVLHEIRSYMSAQIQSNPELSKELFDIPYMNETSLTLQDLTGMLRSCGRVCFALLLQESTMERQGIVQEINAFIQQHFHEGLTIKMLAERFFLNPAYLGQLLMRKNGMGFSEQLHSLRIEEAGRLLQRNEYKNSEIAEMVGYSSYNYFLKQFERRMGMSPNEYKKI